MDDIDESYRKPLLILRVGCVYAYLVFLLVLNASNIPLFDLGYSTPFFLLMGIYYWRLHKPYILPLPCVFLLGLTLDLITAMPAGLNAFSFLLIAFVLGGQRRFLNGQAWPVLWVGFALAAILVAVLHCLAFALLNWRWPGFSPVIVSVIISSLAYPLIAWPMIKLTRFFK